jgi:hypothetical protein
LKIKVGAAIVAVDSKQIVQTILEEYLPRVTNTKLATLLDEFNAIKERAPNLAAIGYRTILSHLIQEQAKAAKPDSELAKKEDLFPSDAIRAAIKEKFFQEAETKLIWNFEKNGQKAVFDNITHKPGANTFARGFAYSKAARAYREAAGLGSSRASLASGATVLSIRATLQLLHSLSASTAQLLWSQMRNVKASCLRGC